MNAVLSVVGKDTVGILAKISSKCAEHKANINNVSQTIISGYFTMFMIIQIDELNFERKKKVFLKSYILDFENIEDVEYNLCESILMDGKVNFMEYSDIMNMDFNTAKEVLSSITFDNVSIIKTI